MIRLWRRRLPPVEHDEFVAKLQSAIPVLYFTARFSADWALGVPLRQQGNPRDAARMLLVETAHEALGARPLAVSEVEEAELRINARLGRLASRSGPEIHIESASVRLTVDTDTAQRGYAFAKQQQDEYLADFAQRRDFARLELFRTTVLRDPGTAAAYWLMKTGTDTKLDKDQYNQLQTIVENVTAHDPASMWLQISRILQGVVNDLSPAHRRDLVAFLIRQVGNYGDHRAASRIQDAADRLNDIEDPGP